MPLICDMTRAHRKVSLDRLLHVREEVAAALAGGAPVVVLESAVIAHGLPYPHNFETALKMEAAVREEGAVPATIGVFEGRLVVGLSSKQIELFAMRRNVAKASRADVSRLVAAGLAGATTVAATLFIAARAGVRVLATGGIGGVHRGGERSLDISADLTELARTPVAVVCSGAKAILDLSRTLEVLETLGVPVAGYATHEFPAFFSRESGLPLSHQVNTPSEAAHLMRTHWELGMSSGIVFANPPPAENALPRSELESLIAGALDSAEVLSIRGKGVTPHLLQELARRSGGRTLRANIALLIENARVAARIAAAYAAGEKGS